MSADQLCPCGFTAASSAPRCKACPIAGSSGTAPLIGTFSGLLGSTSFGAAGGPSPAAPPAPAASPAQNAPTAPSPPLTDGVFEVAYQGQRVTDPQPAGSLMTYSRWKKSAGTFGPTGRVVATFLLLLPLTLMVAAIATGIGIIGAGVYIFVIMPWALRDIWRKAGTPVQPPRPTGVRPRF